MRIDASPAHDLPEIDADAITRSYVICSTPRSGSTLLARMLLSTGKLGVPAEYFNRRSHLHEYIERFGTHNMSALLAGIKSVRSSPNGVFGFKAHFAQFYGLLSEARLSDALPDLKFIFITREDLLRQSVSFDRALRSGSWTAGRSSGRALQYDYRSLIEAMSFIQASNANWERLFAALAISPLRITYEELCAAPAQAVESIFQLLGLAERAEISLDNVGLEMQRDETTEEWVRHFRGGFEGLQGTPEANRDALKALDFAPIRWRDFRRRRPPDSRL